MKEGEISMDYKKKYQKALERAKKGLPIDEVFPELKESEDERIRKWIASYIHRGVFNEEEHPMALKAIEYLERQKEQKPIEWSEEDNRHINTIIHAIHGAGNITPIDGELAEKWLKSLKDRGNFPKSNTNSPSWKPSEEQIDALEWMLTTVSMKDGGRGVVLKNLINDLKKQM